MIDLVLGDDHAVFVDALCTALPGDGLTVVDVARTAAGTVRSVRRHNPDVCLLDRYFDDGDGIDVIGDVLAAGERTSVLVLTADRESQGVRRALSAGAAGYVNKMCGLATLQAAIQRVAAGEVVVDLAAGRQARTSGATRDAHRLAAQLTARERECLALLAGGAGTGAMVRRLGVSATTVRTHVQSLLTKLGVHSRLEAVSFAVRHGLLDETGPAEKVSG